MTFNNKLHFCPFTCARVTIKTECLQMKNEYVTGIYETGVSSEARLWLWFDCLQGEHRLMKTELSLWLWIYVSLANIYLLFKPLKALPAHYSGCRRKTVDKRNYEAAGRHTHIHLKNIFIPIWRACFLVEALWLVTRGQNYLGALFEMFSCDGARK